MSDVDQLLSEYKQAHRDSGDADPRPYLTRLSGTDRELLAGLIDAYLEAAPRRELDASALRSSPAAPVAEGVQRSLEGQSGMWPSLLPRLRARARLRRAELVAQLAARLGAQAEEEKVALYYHQMEQGLLPERGVSETVLDALGQIVDWSGEALRKAGQMPAPGPPRSDPGAVFARTTVGRVAPPPPGQAPSEDVVAQPADDWDEVDRLFRGGPASA
ncbi:MAG TPA: hypothetical protein VHJ37_12225 [Thermoleophilaceae bacterium]|jgi:hypothetical protein|nr:hypothetical protein [Thermoleophilaceae bacterium]